MELIAGHISGAMANLQKVMSDPEVLKMVHGCKIQSNFSSEEQWLLQKEENKLIDKGTIVPVTDQPSLHADNLCYTWLTSFQCIFMK